MWAQADTSHRTSNRSMRRQSVSIPATFTHNHRSVLYTCRTLVHLESLHVTARYSHSAKWKVLTLCQSDRWNTLGGRGRLNPCALCHHAPKEEKNVSGDASLLSASPPRSLFSPSSLQIFHKLNLSPHCLSLSLYSASKLYVSIYCPCVTLSAPLIVPACVFLSLTLPANSPRPLAAFEVLTVVTVAGCVWQGSPSEAGPHEYSATPFEWPSPGTLSRQLIGCPLSQWVTALSLGQVDMTTGDDGYFTGFSSQKELHKEMWKINSANFVFITAVD